MHTLDQNENINRELEKAIDPWLSHMRWRSDFEKWRDGRLWQEKKQARTLSILKRFLQIASGNPAVPELNHLKILDLGCGMGGLSTALAREGALVTSLDFNLSYCEITRLRGKRYDLKLSPVNGGGENLPFKAEIFDVVICMDVLEHVQNPEDLLEETGRVLKPGGLLYFTAINRFAFNDPHYHLKGVNWLPRSLAPKFLAFAGRKKDNSRFTDRQTLTEMHYFRYRDLLPFAKRHHFIRLEEMGELELSELSSVKGWKRKLAKTLARFNLLKPGYKVYRSFYKGTYQLMLLKEGSSANTNSVKDFL